MNIILVGHAGVGKTSVGECLGMFLPKFTRIDTDEKICLLTGRSIYDIFSNDGEEHFRDIEENVIDTYMKRDTQIISTGAGAVMRQPVRYNLMQGFVIYLQASEETLCHRRDTDPSDRSKGKGSKSYRTGLYEDMCDMIIDTEDITPAQAAREIMYAFQTRLLR